MANRGCYSPQFAAKHHVSLLINSLKETLQGALIDLDADEVERVSDALAEELERIHNERLTDEDR